MARKKTESAITGPQTFTERIIDVDVTSEMEGSFLEYAYSVIYSRALPDARDGLKPVHRRILFQMADMGLRPDRPYVKSARVVGEVMGKLHPHGDSAIYDTLVRLAQPFTLRLPLVDGHGNFGSLDNGPAASRYTEARLAPAAMAMTRDLDEDVVDFIPNYDNKLTQPDVLPASIPNLLVNGASGIAVGMATNMPPHNLVEVISAARHLLKHPDASLEDLMRFVPGPDLPGGGRIVGLEGVRDAYRSGRGTFKTRATTRIENVTPRRKGIVVTELPYMIGPEKVIEKIKEGVQNKKISGISDVTDLTDRQHGLRLVIEVKNGFNPDAVLATLHKLTPLEESFGINNVALVDGQPRTLGLRELLAVWVEHRVTVVRRRSEYRLARRRERLHLVDGLLIAILDIDEVIQVIRSSDDTDTARGRLEEIFELSRLQADYILELRLRRLTKFSRIELETEQATLRAEIAELEALLADEAKLKGVVGEEMTAVAATHGTPRRTVLLEGDAAVTSAAGADMPLEVADSPCWVLLSATGLMARTSDGAEPIRGGTRHAHDGIRSAVAATARGTVAVVTDRGRAIKLDILELPVLPPTQSAPTLSGGLPAAELVELEPDEAVIAAVSIDSFAPPVALGTAAGVVKRVSAGDIPANRDSWEIIGLKGADRVVGAAHCTDDDDLVLVSSAAALLRFAGGLVRPQGRAAGGMAGMRLSDGQRLIHFAVVPAGTAGQSCVVTIAGSQDVLAGTQTGSAKVTNFSVFPSKGRATAGVRAHRFLKGEDALLTAWVGPKPPLGSGPGGQPVELPELDEKRDGSGAPLAAPVETIG